MLETSQAPFIHPQAIVEPGARIGPRSRVWAFAHILGGATIGADCNICDHVFIENEVVLGDRVTVKCGIYIWDGAIIEDDVFLGPNVVFTNDMYPRSRRRPPIYLPVFVKQWASIGANATLLPGITVGQGAMVGAGSVITQDVANFALVMGNPARQRGWICICNEPLNVAAGGQHTCRCERVYAHDGKVIQLIEEPFEAHY